LKPPDPKPPMKEAPQVEPPKKRTAFRVIEGGKQTE